MTWRWLLAVVVLAVGVATAIEPWTSTDVSAAEQLAQAKEQFATGLFEEAERLALAAVSEDPSLIFAWVIAGESALHSRQFDRALAHFSEVGGEVRRDLIPRARYGEAIAAFEARQWGRCERCLRQALEHQPGWYEARLRLIRLLGATGRQWEQVSHITTLLRNRHNQAELLLILLKPDQLAGSVDQLEEVTQVEPTNPFGWLGMGCMAVHFRQMTRAGELLQQARLLHPNHPEIEIRWGMWLFDNQPERFTEWHAGLPVGTEEHPRLWVLRARWAEREGQPLAAIRCLLEALLLDPDIHEANSDVGRMLEGLGRTQEAEPFLDRGRRLFQLSEIADRMRQERSNRSDVGRMTRLLEQCGRSWEATAWTILVNEFHPDPERAGSTFHRRLPKTHTGGHRTAVEDQPARTMTTSDFPLPSIMQENDSKAVGVDVPPPL